MTDVMAIKFDAIVNKVKLVLNLLSLCKLLETFRLYHPQHHLSHLIHIHPLNFINFHCLGELLNHLGADDPNLRLLILQQIHNQPPRLKPINIHIVPNFHLPLYNLHLPTQPLQHIPQHKLINIIPSE